MYDLTGFQRDLLTVTAGIEEPHGLAIKDELEDYYEKEIHHGRLYPNLDTLVEKRTGRKRRERPPYQRLHRHQERAARNRSTPQMGKPVHRPITCTGQYPHSHNQDTSRTLSLRSFHNVCIRISRCQQASETVSLPAAEMSSLWVDDFSASGTLCPGFLLSDWVSY